MHFQYEAITSIIIYTKEVFIDWYDRFELLFFFFFFFSFLTSCISCNSHDEGRREHGFLSVLF